MKSALNLNNTVKKWMDGCVWLKMAEKYVSGEDSADSDTPVVVVSPA